MFTYTMRKDNTPKIGNKRYYITANQSVHFMTSNMTLKQAVKLMYDMRTLGINIVVDKKLMKVIEKTLDKVSF